MRYHCLFIIVILLYPASCLSGQVLVSDVSGTYDRDLSLVVIQAGAFRNESNAIALEKRISDLLNQNVMMIPEEGYFKVRISGFKTPEELEKTITALGFLGLGKVWVRYPKIQQTIVADSGLTNRNLINDTLPLAIKNDSIIPEGKMNINDTIRVALMVGVFHEKADALMARRRIESKFNLKVTIIQEWEYYKVIVSGFRSVQETVPYYPQLAKLGYPDILLIRNY